MYELIYSKWPGRFAMFVYNPEFLKYETKQFDHFYIEPCRTKISRMTIKSQATFIWNESISKYRCWLLYWYIFETCKGISKVSMFKSYMKNFILILSQLHLYRPSLRVMWIIIVVIICYILKAIVYVIL